MFREEDIKSIQEIQVILLQAKDLLTKLEIKQDHETIEVQSSLPCSPVSRKDAIIMLNKNLQQILQVSILDENIFMFIINIFFNMETK